MKQILKSEIFERRKSLSREEVKEKSRIIKEKLNSMPEFKKSKNILTYVSFNNEVDTINIINGLLTKNEKKVLVPYVDKDKVIQISKINSFDDLEPKTFGILEPKRNKIKKFDIDKLDLVIVPGIAFDKNGHRIGYGHGYYDRFLEKIKKDTAKIALAFDFQIVDKIPEERHDVPVDVVVTEKRVIICNGDIKDN